MAYPRRLGDSGNPNCADADFAAAYPDTCSGLSFPSQSLPSSGPSIFETILTDVTQFFHPGTPSPRPLYTPGSTSAQNLLSNPLVLGLGLLLVVKLAKSR